MKELILIESAEELLKFADQSPRSKGNKCPKLPSDSKLWFTFSLINVGVRNVGVRLEAEGFRLANHIRVKDVLSALCKKAGLECEFLA
jgi:hypothetical protein